MVKNKKKPVPPADIINEDSGPPVTEVKEPKKNPGGEGIDIDDAQIEEPRDDVFKKSPEPLRPPVPLRKKA